MDRKKTIVIAVMINAGLLAVLFIAAMTMQDESVDSLEIARGPKQETLLLQKPLFTETVTAPSSTTSVLQPMELLLPQKTAEPVVHKLPATLTAEPTPPITPLSLPLPAPSPTLSSRPTLIEITVQKGDSLEKIAKKHHTSVDELIKLNQLPSSFLKVGQCLKIPAEKALPAPMSQKAPFPAINDKAEYYTMKVGDNPWSIAIKHHIKVDELLKLNALNEQSARKLKPGDRLRIR